MKKENAPYGARITRSGYIAAMFSRSRYARTVRLPRTGYAGCASLDKFASSPASRKFIAIAEGAGTDAIHPLASGNGAQGGKIASDALSSVAAETSRTSARHSKQSGAGWTRTDGCMKRPADGSRRWYGERKSSHPESPRPHAGAQRFDPEAERPDHEEARFSAEAERPDHEEARFSAEAERPDHEEERFSAEVERPDHEEERLSAEAERFNRSHSPFRRARGQFHL